MQVHTVKRGESIFGIARKHAISPRGIIEVNGLENPDVLAVGQELLILLPSRSYTAAAGDTVGAVARRFGIRREDIFAANPQLLCDERLYEGQLIALGYGDARLGMAASNGYLYRGYSEEALRRALPYLTYLTVAAAIAEGGEITSLFDGRAAVRIANENGKIPILRVYVKDGSAIYGDEARGSFISRLIAFATEGGYRGICLSMPEQGEGARAYEEFIISLRKQMIGSGLILFTEAVCDRECGYADYADGCVLSYDKPLLSGATDFERGERRAFTEYAEASESTKTFMDITSFAISDGDFLTYGDAVKTAAKVGAEISTDKSSGVCSYSYHGKDGRAIEVRYESLKNIIAKLELLGELGYMGISFDINRTPVAHLMAYTALFSGICYTSVFSSGL